MKKSFKQALGVLTGLCLFAALIGGCGQTGQQRAPGQYGAGQDNQATGYGNNNMLGVRYGTTIGGNTTGDMAGTVPGGNAGTSPGLNNNNNVTGTQMTSADRQRASRIKRQLLGMRDVAEADVIVMGDTCLVGIKTAGNAGNTEDTRNSVARRVKQADNTIKNCTVSDSSDTLDRIRRLVNATGDSTVNFADEFNKLVRGSNMMAR
ncbi:MAG: YhcN/YlaJ family sporulation lipoprotein [Acetivibrionales bacterium]